MRANKLPSFFKNKQVKLFTKKDKHNNPRNYKKVERCGEMWMKIP
jgi:hypothetical protein